MEKLFLRPVANPLGTQRSAKAASNIHHQRSPYGVNSNSYIPYCKHFAGKKIKQAVEYHKRNTIAEGHSRKQRQAYQQKEEQLV